MPAGCALPQVHFHRWAYIPASPSVGAVSAAINPTSQLLALGLAHGRVAIYSLPSLLSLRRASTTGGSVHGGHGLGGGGGGSAAPTPQQPAAGGGGAPDPLRVLSLTDWGYSSTVTGGAAVMQWSPDGRVLAVGYGRRGMAVWTPSGCRLMCSLRQAAPAAAPQSAALQPGLHGTHVPATPREQRGTPSAAPREQLRGAGSPRRGAAQKAQPRPQPQAQGQAQPSGAELDPSPSTSPTSLLQHQSSLLSQQALVPEAGVMEVCGPAGGQAGGQVEPSP